MSEPNMNNPMSDNDLIGGSDESSSSMSLMGGIVGPEGLPEIDQIGLVDSVTASKRILTQGSMLILGVFVIAAGTLYGMRISQQVEGPSTTTKSAEAKIDQALKKLASGNTTASDGSPNSGVMTNMFQSTDQIVSVFSADLTKRQVPARFVKKNPFVLPVFQSVATPDIESNADEERERRLRLRALNQELKGLVLQSIMQGSRPVAIISGEMLQPNQSIGNFTIMAIHDRWVELVNDGEIFPLRMPNPNDKDNRSFRGRRR